MWVERFHKSTTLIIVHLYVTQMITNDEFPSTIVHANGSNVTAVLGDMGKRARQRTRQGTPNFNRVSMRGQDGTQHIVVQSTPYW